MTSQKMCYAVLNLYFSVRQQLFTNICRYDWQDTYITHRVSEIPNSCYARDEFKKQKLSTGEYILKIDLFIYLVFLISADLTDRFTTSTIWSDLLYFLTVVGSLRPSTTFPGTCFGLRLENSIEIPYDNNRQEPKLLIYFRLSLRHTNVQVLVLF